MTELVLDVLESVAVGTETHQAFLVNEDGQGRNARYQHVNAQVPFVAVDEVRIRDVPLDYARLLQAINLINIINQKDVPTPR